MVWRGAIIRGKRIEVGIMTTVAILPISDPGGEKSYRAIAADRVTCVATK